MGMIQFRLDHFVYVQLKHGISFFGHIEIRLFLEDPTGWWIESVFDNDGLPVPDMWSQQIKEAIEANVSISSDITFRCKKAARVR